MNLPGYTTEFVTVSSPDKARQEFSGVVWLNLTNGILADSVNDRRLMRIQSTQMERGDYLGMLDAVPLEFILNCYLGVPQTIVDFSAHSLIPRSLRQGVPFLERALRHSWGMEIPKHLYFPRRMANGYTGADGRTEMLSVSCHPRLKYVRMLLGGEVPDTIGIRCVTGRTDRDGDYEYLGRKMNERYGRLM